MAEAGEETLDAILAREEGEINDLLKNAGIPADPDGILAEGAEAEVVPEAEETAKEIHTEAEPEPEPEKEPEPTPETQDPKPEPEPTPEPEPEKKEAQPEKKKRETVPVWKALRDADRRAKQLEAENIELKKKLETRPADQDIITDLDDQDPIKKLELKQEEIDRQLAQQKEDNRQRDLANSIKSDEDRFKISHPDYDEALGFIAQRARQRFSATGELEEQMQLVLKNHHDVIDRVLEHNNISNPDDDQVYQAAENIAFAVMFEQERQKFVSRTHARGKSIAEAAYNLAESEGYSRTDKETRRQGDTETPETAAQPAAPKESPKEAAQKRVERQAKLAVANQSLSAMQNGGPAKTLDVKSKTAFMQLTPEAQDLFIAKMEDIDPDWHQKLPD